MGKRTLPGAALVALVLSLSNAACARHHQPTAPQQQSTTDSPGSTHIPNLPNSTSIRAGYFYSYVSTFHLDSLANTGFNRAIVKFIGDSLGTRGAGELHAWMDRGTHVPVEVTPSWSLQSVARLASLATTRRYTWGSGTPEPDVGCPLDSLFWRSTFLDHANELLSVTPGVQRLALDLEIYTGTPHHYLEPCLCSVCRNEFALSVGEPSLRDLSGPATHEPGPLPGERTEAATLASFEEARVTELLAALVSEFAHAHPGVELGIFDLDRDSFVHRAMARALARAGVPAVDYTERTYSTGASTVSQAQAALQALGVVAPVVGGLWLKQFPPAGLPSAVHAMLDQAGGYFAFTTFSLWVEPSKLVGAYALQGTQAEYWAALRLANH